MKPIKGIDYAWDRPSIEALKHYGAKFVCRYLSRQDSKDLSRIEAMALADAGIWMVVVWETTANRASAGREAGVTDARLALAKARALGMPEDRPIYFAVDYDSPGTDTVEYFTGIRSVLPLHRIGVYGGLRSVVFLYSRGYVKWVWQTYAWSGGQWFGTTHIQQFDNNITVGGKDCDADRAMYPDYGQWMPGKSPEKVPSEEEDDDMPNGLLHKDETLTAGAFKEGKGSHITLLCDNGLEQKDPVQLRVAVRDAKGWLVTHNVIVDSKKDPVRIKFRDPKTAVGISIQREDTSTVTVAWEVSA